MSLDSTDFLLLVKWPYISVSEWDETALETKVHFSALTRKTSRQHRPGRTESREEPEREINRDKEQRQFFSGGQKSSANTNCATHGTDKSRSTLRSIILTSHPELCAWTQQGTHHHRRNRQQTSIKHLTPHTLKVLKGFLFSTNLIVYFVEGVLQFAVDGGELLKVSVGFVDGTEDLVDLIYGLVHGSLVDRQRLRLGPQ